MRPAFATEHATVYQGHALEILRELPDASVDCIVTSPPYWGLRDYSTDPLVWEPQDAELCAPDAHRWTDGPAIAFTAPAGSAKQASVRGSTSVSSASAFCEVCGAWRGSLGLEPTPELYVWHMVLIFRELRRVLRSHGTVWLNLGDSWAAARGGTSMPAETIAGGKHGVAGEAKHRRGTSEGYEPRRDAPSYGLKHKDLIGIPWRVAFGLQSDGWWLRADNIWQKPNAMPESVEDRTTNAHEYVFHLTKAASYYHDWLAIAEPAVEPAGGSRGGSLGRVGSDLWVAGENHRGAPWQSTGIRNRRSVWAIPTEPYPEAHFATFPEDLARMCILGGCPAEVCATCGRPRERIVERSRSHESGSGKAGRPPMGKNGELVNGGNATLRMGVVIAARTTGWTQCGHAYGLNPDDLELIESPLAEAQPDPERHERRMVTGRGGLDRKRKADEGRRPITRYEQRIYAEQLRRHGAEERGQMILEVGAETFAHYIRTDRSGARPLPARTLEAWIARGWLERVEIPLIKGGAYVPGVVLDPFTGSGTTLAVAIKEHRHGIGSELGPSYVRLAQRRIAAAELDLSRNTPGSALIANEVEDLGPLWATARKEENVHG